MHTSSFLKRCVCHLAVLSSVAAFVFNGKDAPPALYRFFVDMSTCGGALISSRFMITAAHCVVDGERREMEVTTRKVNRVQWTKSYYKRRFPISISASYFTALFGDAYETFSDNGGQVPENLMLSDYAIVELEDPVSVCDDDSLGPLAVLLPLKEDETAENMFKADRHHQCIQAGFGKQNKEEEFENLWEPKSMKQQRISRVFIEKYENGRVLEMSSMRAGVHSCGGDSGSPVFCIVEDYPILMSLGNTGPACGGIHSVSYGPDIHNVMPTIKNLLLRSEWREIMQDQDKCRAYYKENGFLTEYVKRINKNDWPYHGGFYDSFVYPPAESINMDGSHRTAPTGSGTEE